VFHIKLSHINKNIPNGTIQRQNEKNKISARTFLFSILLIFLKNKTIRRNIHKTIQAKLKLYQYGEININSSLLLTGNNQKINTKLKYVHKKYINTINNGNR
jgi:hypothetical protein